MFIYKDQLKEITLAYRKPIQKLVNSLVYICRCTCV